MNALLLLDGSYNPRTATEDEVNAAHKERYAIFMRHYGEVSREHLGQLQERHRQDWIEWIEGQKAQGKRKETDEKIEQRKVQYEESFGVSDKAPPRVIRDVPAPVLNDASPASEVDQAVRGLFGGSMEDHL
jgi:hypothetical protein